MDLAIFEPGSQPSSENVLTRSDDSRAKQHSRLIGSLYTCLVLLTLAYALLAGLKTVVDFDLGWQMAAGRYLLAHHAIPRTELFSYTAHGTEWIYPVLSGVVFYLLHQMGGYAAISWFCALACVATAAVLIYKRNLWAVVLALLAVPVLSSEIMPRASLFTILLFTCFARILVDHFEGRRSPLWLLPLLMVLWVNLHTGFIAGCVLAGAYLTVEALEIPFHSRRTAAISRLQTSASVVDCRRPGDNDQSLGYTHLCRNQQTAVGCPLAERFAGRVGAGTGRECTSGARLENARQRPLVAAWLWNHPRGSMLMAPSYRPGACTVGGGLRLCQTSANGRAMRHPHMSYRRLGAYATLPPTTGFPGTKRASLS